jgi:recombinational DNA repair ATPase RecF
VLWSASGGVASADTLSVTAYRGRLDQVLALVQQAGAAPAADREPLLAQARALLRQTDAVQLPDSTLAIDDGPLADRLTADAIDREIAELGRYIGLTNATIVRRLDAAAADATLHSLTKQQDLAQRLSLGAIVGSLAQRAAQWLYDLVGRPDPNVLLDLQAVVGLLVALAIVALLVRGTRERIRRETALGMTAGEHRADPAVHLRAADEALRSGRPRDAIHALYLYAFATLAAREVLRYDPALTDHELLRRAAQLPRADALRDLVQLHERVWFGLRDAREPDVARARALATEAIE